MIVYYLLINYLIHSSIIILFNSLLVYQFIRLSTCLFIQGGGCYEEESQALGFSMSDSYLAQCGGLSQINLDGHQTQQQQNRVEPLKGPQQNLEEHHTQQRQKLAEHLSEPQQILEKHHNQQLQNLEAHHSGRQLNHENPQKIPEEPHSQFDMTSSISDDMMAQHCDVIFQEIDGKEQNPKNSILPGKYIDLTDYQEMGDVQNECKNDYPKNEQWMKSKRETEKVKYQEQQWDGKNNYSNGNENSHSGQLDKVSNLQQDTQKKISKSSTKTLQNETSNERIYADDIIGEFDSGGQFQAGTSRSGPGSPVNTCALASPSSECSPGDRGEDDREGLLELSGSFSLSLSLSGSPCEENGIETIEDGKLEKKNEHGMSSHGTFCRAESKDEILPGAVNSDYLLKDGKGAKKNGGAKSSRKDFSRSELADERSCKVVENNRDCLLDEGLQFGSDSFDLDSAFKDSTIENIDLEDNISKPSFTTVKPKEKSGTKSNHKTPGNVDKDSRKTVYVVDTPDGFSNSGNESRDSSQGSPVLTSPASPLCSYSAVTMADVTANELLFHHFIKEWKSRKEYSVAMGCERVLDNVPKIGDRFNKGSRMKEGNQKGLSIDGSDEAVVGIAVCWGGRDAYYISLKDCSDVTGGPDESIVASTLSLTTRIAAIKSVLECKGKKKATTYCFDSTAHYKVCD